MLAFDGASLMWRGLKGSKDIENGYAVMFEGKERWVNSHIHGFEATLNYMYSALQEFKLTPINTILVLEGKQSKSRRQLISLAYKGKTDKFEDEYKEFHLLRDKLRQFWLDLGGQVMEQPLAEGDDTLGWLAENTEEDLTIITYDNDISVLNGVNSYGASVRVWVNGLVGMNKYGTFDTKLITLYKALVGDSSDNIKGCVGFGEVAFLQLANQYGQDGLRELDAMMIGQDLSPLAKLAEDPSNKLLKKIFEQAAGVLDSYNMARIRPDWVNTLDQPLEWQPGMVRQLRADDDVRFKKWYGRQRLVTGDIFTQACDWAWPLILKSPEVALDIETSSCDESDEWLAAQSKTGDAEDSGIDVLAHKLTGLSITFGDNNQYSLYFSVDHARTNNCGSEQLRQFIARITAEAGKDLIIHNMNFELTVLYQEWAQKQLDNGFHGFLPNVLDTALSCAYVDENVSRALKFRSETVLKYQQQTYKETVELSGFEGTLPPGGRLLGVTEPTYVVRKVGTGKHEPEFDMVSGEIIGYGAEITRDEEVLDDAGERIVQTPPVHTRRYRMNELTGRHVTAYGCDDTICTIALHNYNRLFCQLEHQWQVYKDVEIKAGYLHAKNFLDGACVSLGKLRELSEIDDEVYDGAWATIRGYLIDQGWSGTSPPTYNGPLTAPEIKEAYQIVVGEKLQSLVKTPSKLVKLIEYEERADPLFVRLLAAAVETGDNTAFQAFVRSKFKGEPIFNFGSPVQKQRLLYEVMDLPIRVRNSPTDAMRSKGEREGGAKTDTLAIAYALRDAIPEQLPVLKAMTLIGMVKTRRQLFYEKYPYFVHWKTGRVHASHNQSSTNTRRASESRPNKQQLSKHEKIAGYAPRIREMIVPHRSDAVIVSIDFKAQELRLVAEFSQDPVMLSMYIGDNLRDQHHLTGLAIAQRQNAERNWLYEDYAHVLEHKNHPDYKEAKDSRNLGKKLNFTAEYLARAKKVAETLMITVEEAQEYLDAREALFEVAGYWKKDVIEEVKEVGIVRSMLGSVRHLGPALRSADNFKRSKAERQAVNFKIQGSAGEQTKLAEGRMWDDNLFFDFDAVYYGPIHDECVCSVRICDLYEFIPRMHASIVGNYAGMKVPIEGSISFGLDFYNQIEIGERPTKEAINHGLSQLWDKDFDKKCTYQYEEAAEAA